MLAAMRATACNRVEPEHLLLAWLRTQDSPLQNTCRRLKPGVDIANLGELLEYAVRSPQPTVLHTTSWSADLLAKSVQSLLEQIATGDPTTSPVFERLLTAAAMEKSRSSIRNIFGRMGIDVEELANQLCARGACGNRTTLQ